MSAMALPALPRDRHPSLLSPSQLSRKRLQALLHQMTAELKARGTRTPHVLLPFRSRVDDAKLEIFLRTLFPNGRLVETSLSHALRAMLAGFDEFTLVCGMKYLWSRLPNNEVVGWKVYLEFRRREHDAGYPKDAFLAIMPKCLLLSAHASIVYDFLDLLISLAANSQYNHLSGRKIAKMASLWAFNTTPHSALPFYDATTTRENTFLDGLDAWKRCSAGLFHLCLSFLRAMLPDTKAETLNLPKTLQSLLATNSYPPPDDSASSKSVIVIPCVQVRTTVPCSDPYELISKVRHTLRFDKKDDFVSIENYTILKSIFRKPSTNDIVDLLTDESRRVLSRLSASPVDSDFGLYPGWVKPTAFDLDIPMYTEVSVSNVALQDYYIWTWLLSLGSDQTAMSKSLFGRSIVVEADLHGFQKWLIISEVTISPEDYINKFKSIDSLSHPVIAGTHHTPISPVKPHKHSVNDPLPPVPPSLANESLLTPQEKSLPEIDTSPLKLSPRPAHTKQDLPPPPPIEKPPALPDVNFSGDQFSLESMSEVGNTNYRRFTSNLSDIDFVAEFKEKTQLQPQKKKPTRPRPPSPMSPVQQQPHSSRSEPNSTGTDPYSARTEPNTARDDEFSFGPKNNSSAPPAHYPSAPVDPNVENPTSRGYTEPFDAYVTPYDYPVLADTPADDPYENYHVPVETLHPISLQKSHTAIPQNLQPQSPKREVRIPRRPVLQESMKQPTSNHAYPSKERVQPLRDSSEDMYQNRHGRDHHSHHDHHRNPSNVYQPSPAPSLQSHELDQERQVSNQHQHTAPYSRDVEEQVYPVTGSQNLDHHGQSALAANAPIPSLRNDMHPQTYNKLSEPYHEQDIVSEDQQPLQRSVVEINEQETDNANSSNQHFNSYALHHHYEEGPILDPVQYHEPSSKDAQDEQRAQRKAERRLKKKKKRKEYDPLKHLPEGPPPGFPPLDMLPDGPPPGFPTIETQVHDEPSAFQYEELAAYPENQHRKRRDNEVNSMPTSYSNLKGTSRQQYDPTVDGPPSHFTTGSQSPIEDRSKGYEQHKYGHEENESFEIQRNDRRNLSSESSQKYSNGFISPPEAKRDQKPSLGNLPRKHLNPNEIPAGISPNRETYAQSSGHNSPHLVSQPQLWGAQEHSTRLVSPHYYQELTQRYSPQLSPQYPSQQYPPLQPSQLYAPKQLLSPTERHAPTQYSHQHHPPQQHQPKQHPPQQYPQQQHPPQQHPPQQHPPQQHPPQEYAPQQYAPQQYPSQQYPPQQYPPQQYPPQQYPPQQYPPQQYPPQQYPPQQYAPQQYAPQQYPPQQYPPQQYPPQKYPLKQYSSEPYAPQPQQVPSALPQSIPHQPGQPPRTMNNAYQTQGPVMPAQMPGQPAYGHPQPVPVQSYNQAAYSPQPQEQAVVPPSTKKTVSDMAVMNLPSHGKFNKNKKPDKAGMRAALTQGAFGI